MNLLASSSREKDPKAVKLLGMFAAPEMPEALVMAITSRAFDTTLWLGTTAERTERRLLLERLMKTTRKDETRRTHRDMVKRMTGCGVDTFETTRDDHVHQYG